MNSYLFELTKINDRFTDDNRELITNMRLGNNYFYYVNKPSYAEFWREAFFSPSKVLYLPFNIDNPKYTTIQQD